MTQPSKESPGKVPATPTHVSASDMSAALRDAWRAELGTLPPSPESLAVVLCQWALETAAGAAMIQFNVGNFKRPSPTSGQLWCEFPTFEYGPHGRFDIRPPNPGCRFAAYASLEEGCAAYLRALYTHWTKAWAAAVAGDVRSFAEGLSAQGYYTAPVVQYLRGMLGHWPAMLAAAQAALAATTSTLPPAPLSSDPVPDLPAVLLPDVTPNSPNTPDDPEEPV